MDHKDFVEKVAGGMAKAPIPPNEEIENMSKEARLDDEAFSIKIPMFTGDVFVVDARNVDWEGLNSKKAELLENEENIRGMVYALVTADHIGAPEDVAELTNEIDKALTGFLNSFGICPGYDKLPTQVQPYVLTLAKCFDAFTLVKTMEHHMEIHQIASQIFAIDQNIQNIAELNDLAEVDNSVDGLISTDREAFMREQLDDDHDVSGLLSE